jgi:hypothetical protein
MKRDTHHSDSQEKQWTTEKIIPSDLRNEVYLLKERLDEYAGCIADLLDQVKTIGDALFKAQQAADCMLAGDLLEACNNVKMEEESVYFDIDKRDDES